MTTFELISYIRSQIKNNISKDLIISKLVGVGWRREDIDEGFSNIESKLKAEPILEVKKEEEKINPVILQVENKNNIIDKYHEPIEGDNIFEIEKESQKIETLIIEEKKAEIPKVEQLIKTEAPKVWTPMSIPIKENIRKEVIDQEVKTTQIEIQNPELPSKEEDKVSQQGGREDFNTTSSLVDLQNPDKNEGFIPNLKPKMAVSSFGTESKDNPISVNESTRNSFIKNLPKVAMLSSYQNDLLSVNNKAKEQTTQKKNGKILKWIIIGFVLLVIALAVWVFASGYIDIKNLNIPFIKKDPKVLLLNNSKVLSSLKSYKTETEITVSSPSFSSITYGLLSGEAVSSGDKDFVSLNVLGLINKNDNVLLSDNSMIVKSSMLSDSVDMDIKNNGSSLFISVSNPSQFIKGSTIEPVLVNIDEQQFELIPSLFSAKVETQLRKVNLYKILSSGMSSYINSETLGAYDELINNVEIIEKEQENIKGIDTYHYLINTDRQLAKNLLVKISDNFLQDLQNEDSDKLNDILGSVTIDSFEVWVGKGDNNIYQYSAVLDIPLSKIIGFEDESVGDNKVSISWKTTYYDFDVLNDISIPEVSISVVDFVKNIKETEMKNSVSSFGQLATDLFNLEKSYGKKSNKNGSCMEPTSGSLFSPIGHPKNTATAISSMSSFLNKILETTKGAGTCYSTSKAWSFAIPISDDYNLASIPEGGYKSFYCVDSTGLAKDLLAFPTSVVCE